MPFPAESPSGMSASEASLLRYVEPMPNHRMTLEALLEERAALRLENARLLQANRDNNDWFDVLKSDFDRLVHAVETSGVAKTSQEISDVLESFRK